MMMTTISIYLPNSWGAPWFWLKRLKRLRLGAAWPSTVGWTPKALFGLLKLTPATWGACTLPPSWAVATVWPFWPLKPNPVWRPGLMEFGSPLLTPPATNPPMPLSELPSSWTPPVKVVPRPWPFPTWVVRPSWGTIWPLASRAAPRLGLKLRSQLPPNRHPPAATAPTAPSPPAARVFWRPWFWLVVGAWKRPGGRNLLLVWGLLARGAAGAGAEAGAGAGAEAGWEGRAREKEAGAGPASSRVVSAGVSWGRGLPATRTRHVDMATRVGGTNLKNSILDFHLETNNGRWEILSYGGGEPTGWSLLYHCCVPSVPGQTDTSLSLLSIYTEVRCSHHHHRHHHQHSRLHSRVSFFLSRHFPPCWHLKPSLNNSPTQCNTHISFLLPCLKPFQSQIIDKMFSQRAFFVKTNT